MTLSGIRNTSKADGVDDSPRKLEVIVVYTGPRSTLCALREAAALAASLHARIRIVLPSLVPYPLQLDQRPVREAHQCTALRTIAGGASVETAAQIIYCRDYIDAFRLLRPQSLVVIADQANWWWPWGSVSRLSRSILRAGHHLIPVPAKGVKGA
jgi:hypothetical protein